MRGLLSAHQRSARARRLPRALPGPEARRPRPAVRRPDGQHRLLSRDPEGPAGNSDPGDARGQGRDGRQARRDHARPGRRDRGYCPRDRPDLLNLLFRTLRRAGVRGGGPPRGRGRDRTRCRDRRPRPSPAQPRDPAGLVLRTGNLWRHPHRHRLAPDRPVPFLHRREGCRGCRQRHHQPRACRRSRV